MTAILNRVAPWVWRAFLEAGLIVFAVMLGFLVTEWREDHRRGQVAHDALERIVAEMESNLEALESVVGYHEQIRDDLAALSAQVEAGQASANGVLIERVMPVMPQGVQPPILSTVAWDFATERGALDIVEYGVVEEIARLYSIQDLGTASTWRAIVDMVFFHPDTFRERDISSSLVFMQMGFGELAAQERSLIYTYEQVLPRIRAQTAD
jgi:signal transduction protein with GAF and PtsI domain